MSTRSLEKMLHIFLFEYKYTQLIYTSMSLLVTSSGTVSSQLDWSSGKYKLLQ